MSNSAPAQPPKPPQLRMRHPLKVPPPTAPALPSGHTLRDGTRSDEAALARIMTEAFSETWDVARIQKALFDDKSVDRTFIVECNGEVVATASHQVRPEPNPKAGWVHWVACSPRHSGKKLGVIVTLAVLNESIRQKRPEVYLQTDDFRLPAIASYLFCGFEPDMWHDSHPDRWAKVRAELAKRK
ncbi:MAG TPA: GNAT family N-acetyltransferase [Planctomycetota bacterium]|nr:GNAT family N-acetyltransferase [Planctomycetota bacterium]